MTHLSCKGHFAHSVMRARSTS